MCLENIWTKEPFKKFLFTVSVWLTASSPIDAEMAPPVPERSGSCTEGGTPHTFTN